MLQAVPVKFINEVPAVIVPVPAATAVIMFKVLLFNLNVPALAMVILSAPTEYPAVSNAPDDNNSSESPMSKASPRVTVIPDWLSRT